MVDAPRWIEYPSTLTVSGWNIPAALTLPAPRDPSKPVESAILLVPGSLFSDVNGDYPAWNVFPHASADLAHKLAAHGHAVYRFAKLGPGTGSVATDVDASAKVRSWDGRVVIAAAALDGMHEQLAAQGVRAARTVAAGHSEGSVVVSRLAISDRSNDLDGVVLLAGPSVGILAIMREQGMDMRVVETMPEEGRRYLYDCDSTDPKALAAAIAQPVLVVQGGNDISVPAHHAEALLEALRARTDGERRTSYLFVPGLSHMFKEVPRGTPPPAAFAYPGETDDRVTDGIDRWIAAL
jgi:hypothetical protein